jgi:hypothetical protein
MAIDDLLMWFVAYSFITGMLPREKMGTFERVLWRALRGNLFLRESEVADPIRDPNSVCDSSVAMVVAMVVASSLCCTATRLIQHLVLCVCWACVCVCVNQRAS